MYTSDERLYLTEDKSTVVREGDPAARYLLVAEGGELSDEEATRYGLTGKQAQAPADEVDGEHEDAKAQAPAANKAKRPAENK